MSKPIVAFNVGVHKDVLVHESNAMVYEIGDFNGYLEGIHRVQNDALLRNKLSEGARNLFQFMTDRRRVFDALEAGVWIRGVIHVQKKCLRVKTNEQASRGVRKSCARHNDSGNQHCRRSCYGPHLPAFL